MSVSLHGYFNGLHFHETFNAKLCKKGENCSRHNYHEEEVCAYQNSLLEDYKNEFGQGQGPYFPTKYPKQACPSRWMVVPQVFIIASAWVGTLTVLIVLSTLDISNNKSFAVLVSTTNLTNCKTFNSLAKSLNFTFLAGQFLGYDWSFTSSWINNCVGSLSDWLQYLGEATIRV